jgi:hypothetical protein
MLIAFLCRTDAVINSAGVASGNASALLPFIILALLAGFFNIDPCQYCSSDYPSLVCSNV